MKKLTVLLALTSVLALPNLAQARPVTLTTQLQNYGGNAAFLAFYVTDTNGQYTKTLWVAGKKTKYYKSLRDWARGSGLKASEYDAISGASLASGATLKITVEVDDALIDTGYEIRIDSAVEDKRDSPAEVRVALTTENADKPVLGRIYIKSFTYSLSPSTP